MSETEKFAIETRKLEIGMFCFCISAFLHRSSIGVGIGVAMTFYFL